MRFLAVALLCMLVLALPTDAATRPKCIQQGEITSGRFLRTEVNGTIVLLGGRPVYLEGIRLPKGVKDRAPQSLVEQALSAIKTLAGGGALSLVTIEPRKDRHDRVRAQVFSGDTWLQRELLIRGLARVSIAPDRTECARELFAAEAGARGANVGLWAAPPYAIRMPDDLWRDIGTFQIVEGKVLSARVRTHNQ